MASDLAGATSDAKRNEAMKRIDDFSTHYFITLDEPFQAKPPNFVNIVSLPVLRWQECKESRR